MRYGWRVRIVAATWMGLCLCGVVGAQEASEDTKSIEHAETVDQAIAMIYGDGSWIQAVQDLVKMSPETRESFRWKLAYGLAYLKGGRDAKVMQYWPTLLEAKPKSVELTLSLALSQLRAGKATEAAESFAKVAAQASPDPLVAYAMAIAEAMKGHWAVAERQFDSLVKQGGAVAKQAEQRVLEIGAYRKHVAPARQKLTEAVTSAEADVKRTEQQIAGTQADGKKATAALAALKKLYDAARQQVYDRYREDVRDAERVLARNMPPIALQKTNPTEYARRAAQARRLYAEDTRDIRDTRDEGYDSIDSQFAPDVTEQRKTLADLAAKLKSLKSDLARFQAARDRAIFKRNQAGPSTPFDAVKASQDVSLQLCRPLLGVPAAPASAPAK